jgi:hypothetical protein
MTKRHMTCTCCGGDAGRFEQRWNQDNGFSVCAECLDWITTRENLCKADSLSRYGRPQINHGGPEATA